MKITSISVYVPETNKLGLLFPIMDIALQAALPCVQATRSLIHSQYHKIHDRLRFKGEDGEQFYLQEKNGIILIFSTPAVLADAYAYQCFALIRHQLTLEEKDVPSLMTALNDILENAEAEEKALLEKTKKIQAALKALDEQLFTDCELAIERGMKLESLLAKTEQLSETTHDLSFRTKAFKTPPTSPLLSFFQSFVCSTDSVSSTTRKNTKK